MKTVRDKMGLPFEECPAYNPEEDRCMAGWLVMVLCPDHRKCPKTVYYLKYKKKRKDGLVEVHWTFKEECYK